RRRSCCYLLFKFCLEIMRPPPWSTLFPYTTLFRSECRLQRLGALADCRATACRGRRSSPCRGGSRRRRAPARSARFPEGRPEPRDRKSTRLNSSHVKISYAVFCLKKKKKAVRMQSG